MGTRPGDPRHGEETEPQDERQGSDGRMYQLIRHHDGLRERTLETTFLESDAEALSFTFGDGDR